MSTSTVAPLLLLNSQLSPVVLACTVIVPETPPARNRPTVAFTWSQVGAGDGAVVVVAGGIVPLAADGRPVPLQPRARK